MQCDKFFRRQCILVMFVCVTGRGRCNRLWDAEELGNDGRRRRRQWSHHCYRHGHHREVESQPSVSIPAVGRSGWNVLECTEFRTCISWLIAILYNFQLATQRSWVWISAMPCYQAATLVKLFTPTRLAGCSGLAVAYCAAVWEVWIMPPAVHLSRQPLWTQAAAPLLQRLGRLSLLHPVGW